MTIPKVDYSKLALPKPEPRQKAKARKTRQARRVVRSVRELVGLRDGDCRIGATTSLFGPCEGRSEWAHLEDLRRFKTRGQDPVVRHTTKGTCRLCAKHHAMYDREKTLAFALLTGLGADGTLRISGSGRSVLSVPPRPAEGR